MEKRLCERGAAPFVVLLCAACGESVELADEAPSLGEAPGSVIYDNAMNPNAMNPNALSPGALSPSWLKGLATDSRISAALQDPGQGGDLSRALVKYVASCALDTTQSYAFTWVDSLGVSHPEVYPGLLGLATSWGSAPLDTAEQEWVSACVASRANWYGATVMLSSRGAHPRLEHQTLIERVLFDEEEGAFWGNIFTNPPRAYACHWDANVAYSRLQLRDCAAGHIDSNGATVECGIIHIVGSCDAMCAPLYPSGSYHPSCTDGAGGTSRRAVTTFLR